MLIDATEMDRMTLAVHMGEHADRLFLAECAELLLDPAVALAYGPIEALAYRRARICQHAGHA